MLVRPIGIIAAAVATATALALLLASTGCSGYRQFDRSDTAHQLVGDAGPGDVVAVGKYVRVRTADGGLVKGRVESVGPTEFSVDGRAVLFSEVESVQVRSLLWTPTVVALGTAAFVVRMITYNSGIFSPNNE